MTNNAKAKPNGKAAQRSISELRSCVWAIRDGLGAALTERDDSIEAHLSAFVCQEHIVTEGPPGTAKSLLADAINQCVTGGEYTRKLCHKFVTADEIIGPMDLGYFKTANVYRRVLGGGAAAATGLFLDEIFKSNSAVLNTLLTLLEERQYSDQGNGTVDVPLRFCCSASNEFPQEDILAALYDRFLFRDQVGYIASRDAKRQLLLGKATKSKAAQKFVPPCTITVEEWDRIREDVDKVELPPSLIDKFLDFQDLLSKDGIVLSDRRSVKVLRAIKASAWLDGDSTATVDHLFVLRFCCWDTPEQRDKVLAACNTLEKSATREALDEIDAALRAYRGIPVEPDAEIRAIGKVLPLITRTGKSVSAKKKAGAFTKRGAEKIGRRMKELQDAYRDLESRVRI
jgi:MoxR-like ATPase